jgi:hypothetical protein
MCQSLCSEVAEEEDDTPPAPRASTSQRGRTLVHFRAQLEDLQDTSLTLEFNLSNFGHIHGFSWVILGNRMS